MELTNNILKVDMNDETSISSGIKRAAEILLSGGVVAIPTETFYGLAVNAMDEKAIERLFRIKGRRSENPILILIPLELFG